MDQTPLPCPFCGSNPTFTAPQERDDRRYVAMELECCVVMTTTISWPHFDRLTKQQLIAKMKANITKEWNTRYVPEQDEE